MKITQIDLDNRKQVKDFINLPFGLYKGNPYWVPPLEMDIRAVLNPKKHPFYRHSEAAFFLAYDEKDCPVGRIGVMDNRRYNDYYQAKTACFHLFECRNDVAISQALFEATFKWAHERGLNRMIGPRGFTPLDGRGLLVEGFEYRPAFGIAYNLPYYPKLVEAAGFHQHHDYLSGYLRRETAVFPERVHELAERVATRRGLKIVHYKSRRELRNLIPLIENLYNNSLSGTRDNFPVDKTDVAAMADLLLLFADPGLIKLVMKDTEIAGFIMAYPDISTAIQKTKGKLFPFGWIALLLELKRTDWIDMNGIGLKEAYRGVGGTAILASEIAKTLIANHQYRVADFVQVDTTNENMLREIANFGVAFCKRHRVYARDL